MRVVSAFASRWPNTELGVKLSVAIAHKQGRMVGVRRWPGLPNGGHTWAEQLGQVGILTAATGATHQQVAVDLGGAGVNAAKCVRADHPLSQV